MEELDALLPTQVKVHCIGGFVVSLFYGLPRPTGDIDYHAVVPHSCVANVQALAGADSALSKKYKIHFQFVTVNNLPVSYESRLVEMFHGCFNKLRLYAPDPYDLILSKLERNSHKDRDDVEYLVKTLDLNPEILRKRYNEELRPYLMNEERHNLTLDQWLKILFPQDLSRP